MSELEPPAAGRRPAGAGAAVVGRLVALAASMRAGGARVGVGQVIGAHRALAAVDAADRDAAYLALRAVLCSRRGDLAVFDAAFAACFSGTASTDQGAPPPGLGEATKLVLPRTSLPSPGVHPPAEPEPERELVPAAWSDVELLRRKDFAAYTDDERARARLLVARIALRGPSRLSRRTRVARRRGPRPQGSRPDLRRTIRSSLRNGGEPVERRWRERAHKRRPLVLVADVSGSMEPYARVLLQYMQACVASQRRVEAFAFGTRLTRLTPQLRGRDPDRALDRASGAAGDWSGGTRIGEALHALNREHGRRLGRGAVVVVLSDGWDRGDPELLGREMARLSRCAHRLVWLNPLKAHPGYEPLARGMVAALPHVDDFLAGNSIASLEELADLLDGGTG